MRAPLMGGLEYMGRTMILSCDSARCALSVSCATCQREERHKLCCY